MLIFQKNSFKKQDFVTNAGFAASILLLGFVFIALPVIMGLLQIKQFNPFILVSLPSLCIIPVLCTVVYFTGRKGRLFKKLRLVNWDELHIPRSIISMIILVLVISIPLSLYQNLLNAMGYPKDIPRINSIVANADFHMRIAIAFAVVVLAPISEELVFRRFIFGFLAANFGFYAALIITSLAFAVIHQSLYNLPGLFLLGVGFQLIYLKYGSLYPAILMHACNNALAMFVIIYFPQFAS